MFKVRSFPVILFLAVACLSISIALPVAHGQTLGSTASLSGVVSDPSGARVPNASVTLSNPEKGFMRTFTTDAEGNFSFALLPAATYTLTVEAAGFKTFKQQGITLEVGQSASQSITLSIGAKEQIEVTSTAPLLQTDDASLSAQVSTKQVSELPINLRNVFNFVTLNSSVNNLSQSQVLNAGGEQGSADQDVSFLNFGGGYFGTTAFLLDGTWDTSQGWGGVIYVPSPDNVQEFKVQQNSFTAQYGWSTGNVITVLTKSGTSNLHGSVYDYMRNGALDANYFFNNAKGVPRANEHRNQFGVAVGGPVYLPKVYQQRNKTFFYFLYEGHRENNPASSGEGTVPTTAMRGGDFSALMGAQVGTDALCRPVLAGELYDPYTTRQVTATCAVAGQNTVGQTVYIRDPIAGNNLAHATNGINAIGQKLVNYYPAPVNSALVNNWIAGGTNSDRSNEYSGRIDQNIGENTRLYGRFSWKSESKGEAPDYFGASNPAGPGQTNPNNRWSVALGASQVFTPTFTMSVNVGAMKWVEGNNMASYGFKPSSLGLPSFIDAYSPQFPVINVAGYESEGPLQGAGEARFPRDSGTASVDFNKVRGKHSLSFGYMAVAVDENGGRITPTTFTFDNGGFTAGPNPQAVTAGTGDPIASMMLGTANSGGTGIYLSQITRSWFHGVYLQDDWKATRKLTLNLGLRWEVQVPLRERHNRQAYFDYNAVNPISASVGQSYLGELVFTTPSNRGLYNTDFRNLAPRIGFAYQLMPKLVMRGGYGIFYPPSLRGNGPEPGYTSATPFVASTNGGLTPDQTLSTAFAGGMVPIVGNSLGGLTNVGFTSPAIDPNRASYYMQQWTYGFQYAPTPNDILELTYVGNRGIHVVAGINTNQLNPSFFSMGNALTTLVTNPFYGSITSSGCGLNNPTVLQGQLLRPYPEFCDVNETDAPVGSSNYNALDVSYTHRFSRGLTLLASYTFSKFLDDVGGPEGWASTSGSTTRNIYNLAADKSVDSTDTPNSFVMSYVYEIPVGKGKQFGSGMNGVLNAIAGGWQTTGIFTLKQGFPLSINAPSNTNVGSFGAGQNVDVVGDVHVSNPSINEWFNTSAFAIAQPWTQGDAPRYFSNLRAPRYNNWDMGIQKFFPIHEDIRLQFRVDFFNAFNHPQFYAPNMSYGSGNFGKITTAFTPRLTQAVLKLYW
jgi:hypothetical protein